MNAAATELSELRELVVTLKAALELSRRENALLRQKIDLLVRRVFGSSSEQLDRNQLELLAHQPESVPVQSSRPQRTSHVSNTRARSARLVCPKIFP